MPPMTFHGTKEELQPIEDTLSCFLQSYAAGVPGEIAARFAALSKCLPESNGCLWRAVPDVLTGLGAIQGVVHEVDRQSTIELGKNQLDRLTWALRVFQSFTQTSHPVPPMSQSPSAQHAGRSDRPLTKR